jgi:predicted alpha/beta superfamily hydrolase
MKISLASLSMLFFATTVIAQVKLPPDTKPFVLGVIDEVQSTILSQKRQLNIYLPDGFNPADTTRYPVIYLLDGSADEDFIHTVGIIQFNNFSWINRVPKSIVVGIANIDRKKDFTFQSGSNDDKKLIPTSGNSAKFIDFIEKELQPFISKKYKGGSSRMLIGQSLGGLLATEILLTRPAMFDRYVIISPSIWWDDASLLKKESDIFLESFTHPLSIYIGVGKEGPTPGATPRVMEVDANLLSYKIAATKSKTVKVYFDYLKDENHATITHQAVFNAMRLLYPVIE